MAWVFRRPSWSRRSRWIPLGVAAAAGSITPDFISSAESVYAPDVDGQLTAGFISSVETVYAPEVGGGVEPEFISANDSPVFAPQVDGQLTADFIASAESVPAPQVDGQLTAAFVASAESVYSPTLTGTDEILPVFISSAESVPAPQVDGQLTSGFIASGETVYSPTVAASGILPDFISSGETVYGPTVSGEVQPDAVASGETVYSPTVTPEGGIAPDFIASTSTVYAPADLLAWYDWPVDTTDAVTGSWGEMIRESYLRATYATRDRLPIGGSLTYVQSTETGGGGGTLEQGTSFPDPPNDYLYVVFGPDGNWEAIRWRPSVGDATTGAGQTGPAPTTLTTLRGLTYS